MTAISDAQKEELGQFFTEGEHEVTIMGTALEEGNGKEYLEVGVKGQNGEEASVRLYLTDDAMKYSIDAIRKIFVHNQTDDKAKEAAKNAVNACKTTEELAALCTKLDGKKCWYTTYKTGSTYVNSQGETKESYSNRIWGFKPPAPKPTTVQKTAEAMGGSKPLTKDDLNEFPDFK